MTHIDAWSVQGRSQLVQAATIQPVAVDTLKAHSRITDDELDRTLLPLRIAAATRWAEAYTGRACISQQWALWLDCPPLGDTILLPKNPVLSVDSVSTYDVDGNETVMAASDYDVDFHSEPARVVLKDGKDWPDGPFRAVNGLRVLFTAGYGTTAESVPAGLRAAILLLAAEWNERLEAATDLRLQQIPFGIKALLDPYVVGGL